MEPESSQTTAGVTYTFDNTNTPSEEDGYVYNAAGLLTGISYPSGRSVSYGYDNAGRPNSASNYVSAVTYHPHGAPYQTTLANGVVETAQYNSRLQPYQMEAAKGGSLWKLENFYCPSQQGSCASNNGNVRSQRLTAPKIAGGPLVLNTTYGGDYDGVNRITSATESGEGTGWSLGFNYTTDGSTGQFGNLTLAGDVPAPLLVCGSYNATTNRCTAWGDDAAGNVTGQPGSRTVTYDAENRQRTLVENGTTYTYSYDGEGRRVKKEGGGTSTVYVHDAFGRLAAEYTGGATGAMTPEFLTADHLGSTRLVTDSGGAVKRRYDYHPFVQEIPAGYGNRSTVSNYTTDTFNPKFTGKPRDYESGLQLDYFGARYFSGAQGRFTSPDPLLNSGRRENATGADLGGKRVLEEG